MNAKLDRLIFFTSLPKVGGHTTITLGLCQLLRPHFRELEVWCKTMPGHGFSAPALEELQAMGCRVECLADEEGKLHPWKLIKLIFRAFGQPSTHLFVLTMGHLSLVLALLLARRRSLYYYITHDLSGGTFRRLSLYRRAFEKLVFISPATYHGFLRGGGKGRKVFWAAQCSEMSTDNAQILSAERNAALGQSRSIRFGLIGRLTEQKGADEILRFIDTTTSMCEFHIAGTGPFAEEFQKRDDAYRAGARVRVRFHGAYDPTERVRFLRDFFAEVDWLIVPTLDEWETLCMALLEGLQHGVPCIATRTGGLTSFAMPELGPAPASVFRLIEPADICAVLEGVATSPRPPIALTVRECLDYYSRHFSNEAVGKRWLDLVSCQGEGNSREVGIAGHAELPSQVSE